MAPPPNDNFASAEVISGSSGSTAGTVVDATREGSESSTLHGGTNTDSVWYKFTAPASGWFKFALDDVDYVGGFTVSNLNGCMYVFNDGVLSAHTESSSIAKCSIATVEEPSTTATAANLTSGSIYYIRVSTTQPASSFTFTLKWDEISAIAPANDLYANRIDLGSVPVSETDINTLDSIRETSEVINNTNGTWTGEQSVWYSFTPASTATYTLTVPNSSIDYVGTYADGLSDFYRTYVQIGTGASAAAFSELAELYMYSTVTNDRIRHVNLTSGTEYIIRVSNAFNLKAGSIAESFNAIAHEFDLEIDVTPSAPANDNFANAEELVGTSGTTSGTTLQATNESEPTIGTANAQTVWYYYTPAETGMYKFNIARTSLVNRGDSGGTGNVRLMIFKETVDTIAEATRANQLPAGFMDDTVFQASGSDAQVWVQLYVGNTYYLKAATNSNTAVSNDDVVDFDLDWEFVDPGPANDDLADAISFSGVPDTIAGTTVDSSSEDTEVRAYGFFAEDQSVWYEFTPSTSGKYRFAIDNLVADSLTTTRDIGMFVYEGGSTHASLTLLGGDYTSNDAVTKISSRLDLLSGTSYKVKVFTSNGAGYNNYTTYDFDVSVEEIDTSAPAPPNDDIANAEDLGNDPEGVFPGTNISATTEAFETAEGYDQSSTWYKFTITDTFTQNVIITKTGTDPDWAPYGEIYVDTGGPVDIVNDFFTYIGDDINTPTVAQTAVDWVPGDYYMMVSNWEWDGSWDDYEIEFEEFFDPPPNDNFANRINLGLRYAASVDGTTNGATTEFSEPNTFPGNINPPHPSVWYSWESENYANQPLTVEFATNVTNTYLEVFTGSSISGLTRLDSDLNTGPGGTALCSLSTNGSTNYKIRVSSVLGNTGDFTLTINTIVGGTPPANDDFVDAELMTGFSDSVSGTTVDATGQYDDPGFGFSDGYTLNTVWYKWVPSRTGRVRHEFTSPTTEGMEVYVARVETGGAQEDLVAIDSISNFTSDSFEQYMYFSVETGYDYYFVVMGSGGTEDTFDMSFEMLDVDAPANDEPANAIVLTQSITGSSVNLVTSGANFDTVGPHAGDFETDADENITVWYKWTPAEEGNVYFIFNTADQHITTTLYPTLNFYRGDTPAALTLIGGISETAHPSTFDSITINQYVGETYWMALESYDWITASDIDYKFTFQDVNHGGFNPEIGNGTGDFDTVTGGFVADDEEGVWVASGGVGYGTVEPFVDNMHHPYGWWAKFDLRSTSGDYLYRYGQSQQHIEIFRATKVSGEYYSLVLLGIKNGTQNFAVYKNGSHSTTLGYKAWGANTNGTSDTVRIEVGYWGITIDGRTLASEVGPTGEDDGFRDQPSDQFVEFDFGIRTYPTDGTAYVDLDPEWNFRYSNIVLHDDPERGVIGSTDTATNEISMFHGFTTGQLLWVANQSYTIDIVMAPQNLPEIVASAGDYDGYSARAQVTTLTGNDLYPNGIHLSPSGGIYANPFRDPPVDSQFPGFSFRFYIHDFPSSNLIIAGMDNSFGTSDGSFNAQFLVLGTDGTLYIKPSYNSALIPFCYTQEGKWNYIELQADTHQRLYATKIWLDDVYIGRFESTYNPGYSGSDTGHYPLAGHPNIRPQQLNHFMVGKLGLPDLIAGYFSACTVDIEFRDLATTRRKIDRPIGPTTVIQRNLIATGEHNYPDQDDFPVNATDLAGNGDFSSTDGAGQPTYWTGYDRHDTAPHAPPGGAMYLGYLFQTFADSLVSVVSDGTGPPGLESENAMEVEAVANGAEAAYVFGGGTEPATDVTFPYTYADTLAVNCWVKGPAGHRIQLRATSGIGGWFEQNSFTLTGGWDFAKIYMIPNSYIGIHYITSLLLSFPDSTTGDIYHIKDFQYYVNPENQHPTFYYSEDGGTTGLPLPNNDTTSWELIDEFPPTATDDQIYTATNVFMSAYRGNEDDGKTHIPPLWTDTYLEYEYGEYNDEEPQVFGAKLLFGVKGWNGDTSSTGFDNFTQGGQIALVVANEDGAYRYAGAYNARIHIGDQDETLYALNMPCPPGAGEWNSLKWNAFRMRFGFHGSVHQTGNIIAANQSTGGMITGTTAQLLIYDRRLSPPSCVRPIDLSRVRFRAYEENDLDEL